MYVEGIYRGIYRSLGSRKDSNRSRKFLFSVGYLVMILLGFSGLFKYNSYIDGFG